MNYRSFLKALCSVLVLCFSFVACEPEPPVTGGGNTGGGNTGNKVTYSESGLYMGITGFNNDLYHYMNDGRYFSLLTESSSPRFKGFVNGLKIDISTVLYYAVDASVSNMEQATFPDDMTKVALITFTDGLDEGSFGYDSKYADVTTVSQHLKSARVDGKSIEAYAIGLKGNDVVDEAKFKADLTALSSSAENAMEVKDMSEVDAKFQELAASLYNESQVQSITLTVPVKPNGVKTRFTFEGNLANESQSNCYIEGVWDNNGSLTNVTYVGLKCSSGSTVSSSTVADNKTLRTFTFTDIAKADGSEVVTSKVQVWNMNVGSTVWTPNSEFDPSKNSQTIVEQKSALIMLVLDCSSSLGEEGLQQIKQTVNNFIETLWISASNQHCRVNFNANGGSGSMSSQVFEKGVPQTLNSNTFTRAGYTFTCWNTKADGSGTSYTNGQRVTVNTNTTLYAQWKKYVIYTITFNANGGSGTMSALTVKEGASQKLTANSFTRTGYIFTGWNTKADGSGTSYTNGQTITPTSNLTLYAQWEKLISGTTFTTTVNGVSFKMVGVEGGTFTMGATSEQGSDATSDETPTHKVTLSSYSIGETEVTQELWKAVMGSNPSYFSGNQNPVEQISWNDCQTFITKLNQLTGNKFRLPTEAEWEFAARGGNKSKGYKYAGSNTIGNVAWYTDNSSSKTHPVKQKAANELGLYDMSGNVYEWCQDWYGSYNSSAQIYPTGSSSGSSRVRRGGCWNGSAKLCRVSCRSNYTPSITNYIMGLRLAL